MAFKLLRLRLRAAVARRQSLAKTSDAAGASPVSPPPLGAQSVHATVLVVALARRSQGAGCTPCVSCRALDVSCVPRLSVVSCLVRAEI